MVCEGQNIHGPIFITKATGRTFAKCPPGRFNTGTPRTIEVRNLQSLSFDLNTPIERTPLPETDADEAIAVKAFGNTHTVSLSWTVHQEDPGNCVVLQTLTGGEIQSNCNIGVTCTTQTEMIVKYWLCTFQSDSIQDVYNIYIGDCFADSCMNRIPFGAPCGPASLAEEGKFGFNICATNNFNCAIPWHKSGSIANLRFDKNDKTPVTYTGHLTFYVGNFVASPSECN